MHDGGGGGFGGGDFGGHHGGHGGSVGHHTPAHHSQDGADGQFMAWADPGAGDDASRPRRRGGRDTPAALAWALVAVAVFVIVVVAVMH